MTKFSELAAGRHKNSVIYVEHNLFQQSKRSRTIDLNTTHIIYKYLEEKWTYSYIDKLGRFVKTITSQVNRVFKLAPNKVTKKDVPRLVSLSAQTIEFQRPNFTLEILL